MSIIEISRQLLLLLIDHDLMLAWQSLSLAMGGGEVGRTYIL